MKLTELPFIELFYGSYRLRKCKKGNHRGKWISRWYSHSAARGYDLYFCKDCGAEFLKITEYNLGARFHIVRLYYGEPIRGVDYRITTDEEIVRC